MLRNHVYPLLGSRSFVKIQRAMIRQLVAVKKKEGFSQSTIRNIIAPVRSIFSQAIEDGTAHTNPAARTGKLNKRAKDDPQKKIDPLSRDEIRVLLEIAAEKYPAYYPLFLTAAPQTRRIGIAERYRY